MGNHAALIEKSLLTDGTQSAGGLNPTKLKKVILNLFILLILKVALVAY